MASDFSISSSAGLAARSFALGKASGTLASAEHGSFHEALESASGKKDTPEKIAGAAKEFEALMIGQILKTAREATGGGWLGEDKDQDDQTGSMVMDLAEQGLSQALATKGGLGIAKMVTAKLERSTAKTDASEAKTPNSGSEALPAQSLMSNRTNTDSKH